MTPKLARLEDLARNATPGPWKSLSREIDIGLTMQCLTRQWSVDGPNAFVGFQGTRGPNIPDQTKIDSEYIAACSPDVILELIGKLKVATKALEVIGVTDVTEEWPTDREYLFKNPRACLVETIIRNTELARKALEASNKSTKM